MLWKQKTEVCERGAKTVLHCRPYCRKSSYFAEKPLVKAVTI